MGLHAAVRVRWAGDRCSVCDSDVDYDFDQLVSCDACGITVHQSCYGVPEAPGAQSWPFHLCITLLFVSSSLSQLTGTLEC